MPSAQHEVNQVREAHQNPQTDSINKGAVDQMMNEVHSDRGPKNIKNDHGQLPKEALNGNEALDKAQKMQEKMDKGVLEFTPLFPNKPNADGCLPNLRKQEMMQQAYEMKDKKFDGQSLSKQGAQSVESDRR
ncbi:MAG: hypothetical protein Q8T09_05905 [Candidatus Melainabacteria bacterium]|nr:hypothetical protein [Candidatus Melainabacteria bacterium]